MAIAFNAAADLGNVTSTSLTTAYALGAGSTLLVVGVVGDSVGGGVDDVTGATYAGAAMTLAAKTTGGQGRFSYVYYLLNPAAGTNDVVVSCTSSHFLAVGAADYTGVATSGTIPDVTPVTFTDVVDPPTTGTTTSITTATDNDWTILFQTGFAANAPPTAGAGSTRRTFEGAFGSWGIFDSNGPITPAGVTSMTVDGQNGASTTNKTIIMAAFAPAGGGGGTQVDGSAGNLSNDTGIVRRSRILSPSNSFFRAG